MTTTKREIITYRNHVNYQHDIMGDSFSLKQPHINIWNQLIAFLRKRGYQVGVNEHYKEHYKCLSKYHKIAKRKDIIILLEISARGIEVNIGHTKNFWHDMGQSFWDKWHDKYTKLEYLEDKAVELEIKRVTEFFLKHTENIKSNDDDSKNALEFIFDKEKNNTHIHGGAQSIEEIRIYMETKDMPLYNQLDKNKKKIITGERKYFYDRQTKRLFSGIAVHNINNMWWMIMNNKFTNIACFDLFDYSQDLPRRKPADQNQIERVLNKFIDKKEFLKAHKFSQFHGINKD